MSLGRRFVRDTGLLHNLHAVYGCIDADELEAFVNKPSLELVAL